MPATSEVTQADRIAILAAAADYIESWLDGDGDRMERCMHPELVKRAVYRDADGEAVIDHMTRADMVRETAAGKGRKNERPYETAIQDVYRDIATVRLVSSNYMDYLHIARFDDRWLLVNVLWQGR